MYRAMLKPGLVYMTLTVALVQVSVVVDYADPVHVAHVVESRSSGWTDTEQKSADVLQSFRPLDRAVTPSRKHVCPCEQVLALAAAAVAAPLAVGGRKSLSFSGYL